MEEIPLGFCQCGCGMPTNKHPQSYKKLGWIKGEYKKFIKGHNNRRVINYQDPEIFWTFVSNYGEDCCWIWQRGFHSDGYGQLPSDEFEVGKDRKKLVAHRIAWELINGPIPDKLCVCHNCPTGDNRACCNPNHMFLGTDSENISDMWIKNRGHHPTKFSAELKPLLHQLRTEGKTLRSLAEEFNCSTAVIQYHCSGILTRKNSGQLSSP